MTTINLLESAREAQTAYWNAVRQLEESLGVDIDRARDLQSATIADLIGCSVCRKVFKTCVCGGV